MAEPQYDEFGNYIGPELDEEEEDDEYEGVGAAGGEDEEDEEGWERAEGTAAGAAPAEAAPVEMTDDTRLIPASEATAEQQIILHEDKKYYPSAEEVYGAEADIVYAAEDTQALETPILAASKSRQFSHIETERPDTTFDYKFMAGLMDNMSFVRHVAFAGHIHHGKTSLLDLLVQATHPGIAAKAKQRSADKTMRYADARFDEQERGISVKSHPMSFVLPDVRGKSSLINVIDTPGHVNFSDEQTAAYRLVDGVVLVVDAVEGVMLATERALRHAAQERLAITVCINKIDRLILELKLPPTDAYHKICHTLDEMNAILESVGYFDETKSKDDTSNGNGNAAPSSTSSTSASAASSSSSASPSPSSSTPPRLCLSPAHNNVCFASSLHGWIFSCYSFAKLYADHHRNFSAREFGKRLWGNIYLHASDRKFRTKPENAGQARTFIQFILEPLYKIYSFVLGSEGQDLADLLWSQLGMKLKSSELRLDSKPLLRLVCSTFFGEGTAALVDMVREHVPDPASNAANKITHLYTGALNTPLAKSLLNADPKGCLFVHTAKNIPRSDGSAFDCLGRVMSGTLRVGDRVRVLGEGYSLEDEEDSTEKEVGRLWIMQGRYRVEVNRVIAGNVALIEGIDEAVTKTSTLTYPKSQHKDAADACIIRPLQFQTQSVFKVAIEPLNPAELPRMLEGLRCLDKSYPLAITRVEESGEHVVMGTGELYMDAMMYDLRKMYGFGAAAAAAAIKAGEAPTPTTGSALGASTELEIKISDPQVRFCETVLESSSIKAFAETPNHSNLLTMMAEPLEGGIAEDIENGRVKMDTPPGLNPANDRVRTQYFQRKYNWDLLSARSIWSFGPEQTNGPNMLVDHTLPSEVDRKQLFSVRDSIVQGFQWGTREGPLCDEPIRNVKFKLLDARISDNPLQRARGQIIPTARRVCYSSFLLATPRLMEPVYFVEVQAPADCVSAIYNVLARRRGHVTASIPKPGTPLYTVHAYIPLLDSFGFETDLRTHTQGLAFPLSIFDHWEVMPGDPLDKNIALRPLEPAPLEALARECMIKTRRRKGLAEDVQIQNFFDQTMIDYMARQELGAMQEGNMQI